MISFRMLGSVELRDSQGRELDAILRRPKLLALLGYLTIARPWGFQRRDTLEAGHAEQALDLYRGSLFNGFHVSEVPEFERWLDEERERLRRRACEGAQLLIERDETARNPVGAARWAQRLTELSPFDESAVQRLVELLDRAGDRAGAVRAYQEFARRLGRDLE